MLLDKIHLDLKKALKAREEIYVSTLRFLLAEIHNRESKNKKPLTDEEVVAAIRQQAKMRQESIAAFEKAGRQELADKEEQELKILSKYLPLIRETNACGPKDFGKVMGIVMGRVKGRADGQRVAAQVKELL